ncbi:MAG: ferrous iron transport protein A [Armatimonadetes bacterium]|nr:ferrous iron transport protein A [Armatimonadota bacterium]
MKPLGFLAPGEAGVIKEVAGGIGIRERLRGMGVTKGKALRMIQNNACGPVIVALGETRLALGRGMAQKVLVE